MPHPQVYPPPPQIKGIPTQEEIDAYPKAFSWGRLKEIMASDELGDLKRDPALQRRYDEWSKGIKAEYGTMERYLLTVRLPWRDLTDLSPPSSVLSDSHSTPTPHTSSSAGRSMASLNAHSHLKKRLDGHLPDTPSITPGGGCDPSRAGQDDSRTPVDGIRSPDDQAVESAPNGSPGYLTFELGSELDHNVFAVLPNDWPYNVPTGVTHSVVWSKIPIFHPALIGHDPVKWAKVTQEGFAGRTGSGGSADSGDWHSEGGQEVDHMVRTLWKPDEFECLWRLQSIPGLSHFHVMARPKSLEIE